MPDNRTILVIDDAADIRLLVRTVLSRAGWTVIEANSGVEGCAILRRTPVSVVLLDVQTPDQDGWTSLDEIRSDPVTAAVPVVMCTVKSQRPDQVRGWALGCDGFLIKPFAIADLIDEVSTVAERSLDERLAIRQSRLANLTHMEEAQ